MIKANEYLTLVEESTVLLVLLEVDFQPADDLFGHWEQRVVLGGDVGNSVGDPRISTRFQQLLGSPDKSIIQIIINNNSITTNIRCKLVNRNSRLNVQNEI